MFSLSCSVWHQLELFETCRTQLIVKGEIASHSLSLLYFIV